MNHKGSNPILYQDDAFLIILVKYKQTELPCFISTKSYDKVQDYHWFAKKDKTTYYAVAYNRGWDVTSKAKKPDGTRIVYMHRLLLPGVGPDHVDRNGLNNLDDNLRPATLSQNRVNRRKFVGSSSQHKGVSRHKDKWEARVCSEGKSKYLGIFNDESVAAQVAAAARVEQWGEFAA